MLQNSGEHLVKLYEGCLSADSTRRPSLERVVSELSAHNITQSPPWKFGGNVAAPYFGEGLLSSREHF